MGDAATLDAAARHASAVGAPVDGLADLAIEQGVAGSVYATSITFPSSRPPSVISSARTRFGTASITATSAAISAISTSS
jgi:hypothetical protein